MHKIQKMFKNILLIIGLISIFASIFNQHFNNNAFDTQGNDLVTMVQFDTDSNRDIADNIAATSVLYHQITQNNSTYYSYCASYQEPTLLVHLRPPRTLI
jgi:hypothetical protein